MVRTLRQLILLLVCIFSGVGTLYGEEFLLGRVVEVDYEKLKIDVSPQRTGQEQEKLELAGYITVHLAPENAVLHRNGSVVPQCVYPGSLIRVWGSWEEQGGKDFLASDIRGCRGGGCSDPSGVRMRLMQRRNEHGQGMQNRLDNSE